MWGVGGAARDALVRVAATAAEKKVRLVMARGWAATSSPGEEEARTATATRRDAERLRVAEAPEIAAGMVEDIADIVVASTVRRVLARPASSPMLSWRVSDEIGCLNSLRSLSKIKSRHTRAFWEQPRYAPEGGASPPTMSGLPSDEIQRLNREEWKRLPDNPRAPHGPWMQVRSRTTDRRR